MARWLTARSRMLTYHRSRSVALTEDQFHKSSRFEIEKYTWKVTSTSTIGVKAWWSHQMETFSALLAICAGNSPVRDEFPTQRPVTRSFDFFLFDLRPINGWVNTGEAGDLRRYRAHYDVTVIELKKRQRSVTSIRLRPKVSKLHGCIQRLGILWSFDSKSHFFNIKHEYKQSIE